MGFAGDLAEKLAGETESDGGQRGVFEPAVVIAPSPAEAVTEVVEGQARHENEVGWRSFLPSAPARREIGGTGGAKKAQVVALDAGKGEFFVPRPGWTKPIGLGFHGQEAVNHFG